MTEENRGDADQDLRIAPLRLAPDEVARFVATAFDSYSHGTAFVPRWGAEFLKHVVFDHPDMTSDHALGAYRSVSFFSPSTVTSIENPFELDAEQTIALDARRRRLRLRTAGSMGVVS